MIPPYPDDEDMSTPEARYDYWMKGWAHYSAMLRQGTGGSLPRDWFESLLDFYEEHIPTEPHVTRFI